MKIYNIAIPETVEDTSYPVRAESAEQAAEFYIAAYLEDKLAIVEHDELALGYLEVKAISVDNGGPGLMTYDQPEVDKVLLTDLLIWNAAVAEGFIPGTTPEDWQAGRAAADPAP